MGGEKNRGVSSINCVDVECSREVGEGGRDGGGVCQESLVGGRYHVIRNRTKEVGVRVFV